MNQLLPIRKTQGEQKKQMTAKVDMQEEMGPYRQQIVKIISKMLDNPYGGGLYRTSKCYEALDTLITKIRLEDLEEVKRELHEEHHGNDEMHLGKDFVAYLDSKIESLKGGEIT